MAPHSAPQQPNTLPTEVVKPEQIPEIDGFFFSEDHSLGLEDPFDSPENEECNSVTEEQMLPEAVFSPGGTSTNEGEPSHGGAVAKGTCIMPLLLRYSI